MRKEKLGNLKRMLISRIGQILSLFGLNDRPDFNPIGENRAGLRAANPVGLEVKTEQK